MAFTATFNNITVTMWRSVLWYLPPLSTILQLQCGGQFYGIYHHFQQYYSYNVAVSFMVFTTTFNNITVTMWRSVLWYLPLLSTILQLQCGGQFYGIYRHFQQYYSYNVAVSFMVLTATFNNITVTMWRSVLLVEETIVDTLPDEHTD